MKSPAKIPPKPGKDTIYVDVDDEITAIIDKVDGAKEKVIALVLPKRATVMQSVVNMRLLKRSADKAGKSVVLITGEDALLPLAGAAGLHVAKDLHSQPAVPTAPKGAAAKKEPPKELAGDFDDESDEANAKLDYHRSVGELATAHAEDDAEAIDLEDEDAAEDKTKAVKSKKPKEKRLNVPNFDRFRLLLGGGIFALVLLVVFIILAVFVLPKATITIQTESLPVQANLSLNAADSVKTLDETKNNIPAILETKQQTATQQITATGQQNNGVKASGTMVFYNCNQIDTLSGADHVVPAGTGVSLNGLTYITQANADVFPSHFNGSSCKNDVASNSVGVVAQSAGAKFNQDAAGGYSVSGYSTISGSGSKMTGGSDSIITVVSQADLDTAKNKLTAAETDAFTKTFESDLTSKGFYLLVTTLKLSDPAVTANPALGQQATTSTVTTQITYTILVLQKSDLTKAITDALDKQIDKGKQKLSTSDVLAGATVNVTAQGSPSSATLNVTEDTTAIPTLDVTTIKQQAAGQKSADIKSAVGGLPGVKNVNVKLSPFWVSKAPKASKVVVVQQQVKNSGD